MKHTKNQRFPQSLSESHGISGLTNHLHLLFRPERERYVRRKSEPKNCVFCVAAQRPKSYRTLCVYKSHHSMIVLNKFPYNSGHLLVLPLRHISGFEDLNPTEFNDLMFTMLLALRAIQDIYKPLGINLGANLGAAAGAGIPDHLHLHVIPRWRGDLNFFPLVARSKVLVETLQESYRKFHNYFQSLTETNDTLSQKKIKRIRKRIRTNKK
ncbi:MAG: HIT domain-containing protein [Bdellovibrionaceae bacterium]|nr:HIT domain-containing protein [Pseudobdellovibrionaceae bacterium]MDW8189826.1 HIT domain-containing protein [Pseudobdellovibrionaceae bacterium]